ncbi:MAG TPA: hypothetical protein VEZ48_04760 [Sphingomonadaceae bacterium]|jgi:hypothetical protein|nr:hypothetical protein [Sphingomonadaceae bacterium]
MPQFQPLKASTHPNEKDTSSHRISARAVREALNDAEQKLAWCTRVVGALSGYKSDEATGKDVVEFQQRLYRIIADLETLYRRIKREEKRLIGAKARYTPVWFAKRMAHLSAYSKKLRDGLILARAVGDGFVWFFYERDPQLIDEHLKLQPQLLLPPDLGAAGERILLESLRGVDGKFMLYHGITSLLRIGDFSFIDMTSLRVTCLAELKTSRIDPQRINLSLSIISGDKDQIPKFPMREPNEPRDPAPPLSAPMQARFERQRKVMQESIVAAKKVRDGLTISSDLGFHYRELEDVVRRSHARAFEYVKAGDGLIIGAWRIPGSRSYGAPSPKRQIDRMPELASDMPAWATKILDAGGTWNSIAFGGLGGDESLKARSTGLPFFAWPVDPQVLADIAFERVVVITLFNAGHLIKRLHANGYEVGLDEKGRLKRATKQVDNRVIELENYSYFMSLVPWALMTEDAVMSIIEQTIDATNSVPLDKHPVKVEFRPVIRRSSARDDRSTRKRAKA